MQQEGASFKSSTPDATAETKRLIELSIDLERAVGNLYLNFSHAVEEDDGFWWKLSLEEQNHAALIRSAKEDFLEIGLFPLEILAPSIAELEKSLQIIAEMERRFSSNPPTRREALEAAIQLESSAGEFHFQSAISANPSSRALKLIQKLNRDDKDHESRLVRHLAELPE